MINLIDYVLSFRFINFLWMAGIAVYACRRWVLPGLQQAVSDQKKYIADLRSSVQYVQREQQQLEQAIKEQELRAQELLLKVQAWNKQVQEKTTADEQEMRLHHQKCQVYKVSQYQAVTTLYVQRAVEKDVLSTITSQLTSVYSSSDAQRSFLHTSLVAFAKGGV